MYYIGIKLFLILFITLTAPIIVSFDVSAKPQFVDVYVPWNPVREPKTFGGVLNDCANNSLCNTFAEAAGVSVGLAPGIVTKGLRSFSTIGGTFAERKGGEEWRGDTFAPSGYRICDVKILFHSAAPMHNKYSPTFAATVQSDGHFELYSFVHELKLGKGKSWVDVVALVRFIRLGVPIEKNCYMKNGVKYQYRCNQNRHQGMPICGNLGFQRMPVVR